MMIYHRIRRVYGDLLYNNETLMYVVLLAGNGAAARRALKSKNEAHCMLSCTNEGSPQSDQEVFSDMKTS
jgi:hypothetical protein